ncbi:hypothetical protein Q3G72_012341 [Acer saccharum]|nr:hypothetical protein Q3G72_012341 [Acer saccharum]
MEFNDLSKLCEALSLSVDNDIPETKIKGEIKRTSDRKVAHSLVGKILTMKPINREAFISWVPKLWRTSEPFEINAMGRNIFVFRFKNPEDKRRPLKRALKVGVEDSDEMATIVVRYERLPELCFHCGILGHPLRECPSRRPSEEDGRPLKYRAWIRAGISLGEEPRGKRPRGDGYRHYGAMRQGPLESKVASQWKPKGVLSPPAVEIQGPPGLISNAGHQLSAKLKGKAKISTVENQEACDSVSIIPFKSGTAEIIGNSSKGIVSSLEKHIQPTREVSAVHNDYEKISNVSDLENVIETAADSDPPILAENQELVNTENFAFNEKKVGSNVKGPKSNRRGRPKLGVAHASPYKKDSKAKFRVSGSGLSTKGIRLGPGIEFDKDNWFDVAVENWVATSVKENAGPLEVGLAEEVINGCCLDLVTVESQTPSSVLLNSDDSSLSAGPARQAGWEP